MNSSTETQMPSTIPALITQSLPNWNGCAGRPEARLLRLAVLRGLGHALHAEKSKKLALKQPAGAKDLGFWEERVNSLNVEPVLDDDLVALLEKTPPTGTKTVRVPPQILSWIPREKIEREDRTWEAALAKEGFQIGWSFWQMDSWVEVPAIESWHTDLSRHCWPDAIVLYAEAAEKSKAGKAPAQPGLWHGRWILLARSGFDLAAKISSAVDGWSGSPKAPPSRPGYKQLFPPAKG